MREILFAIILGIVQGLTEFLPISSSGHLTLLQDIFGITENNLFLTVMLHLGTLFAVVVYYFKDLKSLLKPANFNKVWWLFVATIPACLVGFFLNDFLTNTLPKLSLPFCFFISGIFIIFSEIFYKKQTKKKPLNTKNALVIGLVQCVALLPGVSRSGSTISAGLLCKVHKEEVANFSFLLSVPIILGSVILQLFETNLANINWLAILFGMFFAFLSGLFAISLMLKVVKKSNLKWFGFYLLIISCLSMIYYL